jgi:DNA-binding IclR family transcriptional regulator
VLRRGWGATAEEYETGLNAVAAPVRDAEGEVVAALSVSGPSYRFAVATFMDVAPQVVAAADELSRRLGHFG